MADPNTSLDTTERVVKALREIALLGLVAYLAWYLVPFVPKWVAKLDNAQITEVSLAGVVVKLAQVEKNLTQAVKTEPSQKAPSDEAVSSDRKSLVEALETVKTLRTQAAQLESNAGISLPPTKSAATTALPQTDSTFWVYLGLAKGDSIPARNFKISRLPSKGDVIEASTEVYKRNSAPKYKENDGWYLGSTVGVVKAGQKLVVRSLEKIDSDQPGTDVVWAEVVAS